MIRCPWCKIVQPESVALLGELGRFMHYRCRFCGGDFSREAR